MRLRSVQAFSLQLIAALALSACGPTDITISEQGPMVDYAQTNSTKIVFLAGSDSHGPLAHEHEAGAQLLATALRERQPHVSTVNVYGGWPEDESIFANAAAVVMYCDGGRGHLINKHLDSFNTLLARGVGIVALHYCVEVPKDSPSAAAMLAAIGGYFETDWSVNPHWTANYTQLPVHPVSQEVEPFQMLDEWYFNMRFQPHMRGVTPILSAVAPAETMDRRNGAHSGNDAVRQLVADSVPQVTAWAYEREDGGRGFGYTGGHSHANWQDDNARNLVLNAIMWASHVSEKP